MPQPSGSVSRAGSLLAVAIMFFGYGFVMASSYARVPGIRDQLGCTPTQLAFALALLAVAVLLLPIAVLAPAARERVAGTERK